MQNTSFNFYEISCIHICILVKQEYEKYKRKNINEILIYFLTL